jgi:putative membrane protein
MKNIQVKWWLLLLLIISTAVSSCEEDDSNNNNRLTETDFMVAAANSNLFEIQTGQIASGKGTLSDVRELAQHLVMDHTTANNELRALANQKKIILPDSLSEDKRAIRMRLSSESGAAFDKDFINVQITAHDEAISLYERATREIQDPDIRNFAIENLPILQGHREHTAMVKSKTDVL